jgi:hypothetical protein
MKMGMTPDWLEESPRRLHRRFNSKHEFHLEAKKEAALRELIAEELKQRVIRVINHSAVKMYNPIFPVPKSDGSQRKVTDCRNLNDEQKDILFKMEGPEQVIQMAQRGDFATSLDLSSAFNHLLVSEELQPFLCFSFQGTSYAYRGMPFGAKHAPRLFTKALSYPIAFIRRHWRVRILAYMDDIILLHQDPQYLRIATLQIAIYLQSLGWTINLRKSELTPSQTIDFLGWSWDFRSLSLRMTKNMRRSLLSMLKVWIPRAYNGSTVQTRSFASLIGSLSFLRSQLTRAGLYLHALHSNLNRGVRSEGWNGSVMLNAGIASELLWWSRNIIWNTPYDFEYRPSLATLTTDAAEAGWGAVLWLGDQSWTTSGFFRASDRLTSSNQRETAAVLRSLSEFVPQLQEKQIKQITLYSDNMTTVCNIARQNACLPLLRMTRAIFSLLLKADIRIRASHIPGISNTLTDGFSRLDRAGDYELKQEYFQLGIQTLGLKPTVDCFATQLNKKCDRFFAPPGSLMAKGAAEIDALLQHWSLEDLVYLFPPEPLIPRVLKKIRDEKISAVLVVPYWTTHSWWSSVAALIRKSVLLGPAKDVLKMGPSVDPTRTKLPPGRMLMCLVSSDSSIPRSTGSD